MIRSGVVGSWGWVVNWGGFGVIGGGSWGWVIGSWFGVVWSWGRGGVMGSGFGVVGFVMGFSFVPDIGNVTVFVVSVVSHNLDTTVGKSNFIFTGHNTVVILSFSFAEISS